MNDTQLYTQLLGIEAPWSVTCVTLDSETQEVHVRVEALERGLHFPCPECSKRCSLHDHREERRWRHLDSCGFSTFLVARVPRVECDEHGVKSINVPWSSPYSRFTQAFEAFAIAVLQSTMVQSKAAALLRLSKAQIHEVMHHAVERGMERRRQNESDEEIAHVGLDEKSFRRGHHYISVLTDSEGRRVLDVGEGRTLVAAKSLLQKALTPVQRSGVLSITMDMWKAFMGAAANILPDADIIHDRFHVSKYLNDAVDQTRRSEQRELTAANAPESPLSRTRYIWLSNPENLTPAKRALLNSLRENDLMTAKAWAFKEAFREFFGADSLIEARTFFLNWMEFAQESGCKPLTKVALMLQDHLQGLLNYHLHHKTNSTAEGINSQIQRIKANACGFRRFENFRIAILFFLGKLDLSPQNFS